MARSHQRDEPGSYRIGCVGWLCLVALQRVLVGAVRVKNAAHGSPDQVRWDESLWLVVTSVAITPVNVDMRNAGASSPV